MEMNLFLDSLMKAAKAQGLSAAEAYIASGSSFECKATQGEIVDYSVNDTRGLGFRGMYKGKIGYAATEAIDESAIDTLILGVKESAELSEDDSGADIYQGDKDCAAFAAPEEDTASIQSKLDFCLNLEKKMLAYDKAITSAPECIVATGLGGVRLVNSFGLDISYKKAYALAYAEPIAKDGDSVSSIGVLQSAAQFSGLNSDKLVNEAGEAVVFSLHAEPVQSGIYRAILNNEAMQSLLSAFSGVFSAENAQENMSLLNDKEGKKIASEAVTLMDDPLLRNGFGSKPFDAEGVKCCTKAVIENGVLKTLLHNRKTAKKQGVQSTGNAGKAGYAGVIRVSPSNFFFVPGKKSLKELEKEMGNGIVITDLSGLHSGTNAVSGDFSLLSKGYTVENGKKAEPVEQITIAGNFYKLLESVKAVGNDLFFPAAGIGSPSVDIGEISVAGK
jgi:Predicted Zn-dependent proteases and their inactivated homologs